MWKFLVFLSVFVAIAQSCRVDPYQVLVETYTDWSNRFLCSGVLVSPQYVLTTINCVLGFRFINVHVYAHKLRDDFEPQREIYRSEEAIFKPDFDLANYLNDVAMVKLPVVLDIANRPYAVASLPPFEDQLVEGREGKSVGWGLLNYKDDNAAAFKQEQNMKVVNFEVCRQAYPKWNDDSTYFGRVCIQREQGNNCISDFGSPFMIGNVVYGIQSFGQMQACEGTQPNGIQEVRFHGAWIQQIIDA